MHKYILDLWSSRLLWAAHRLQQACRAFKDMAAKSNQTEITTESKGIYFIQDLILRNKKEGESTYKLISNLANVVLWVLNPSHSSFLPNLINYEN